MHFGQAWLNASWSDGCFCMSFGDGSGSAGEVTSHYSSGVGNHLFYLLSEGSGAKTINGIAYNSPTCNGKSVKGIGHDEAAAIWYKALTENWTSTTNYHDARVGMLQAAKDLYGQDSTEYKRVNQAWAAVNVTA